MEYIYCKDSEEFDYTMRTLDRMGYKRMRGNRHYPRAVDKFGITIFISDVFKVIGSDWRYGFAPYQYNCKPSKALEKMQNNTNETNEVSFNKFTNPINEVKKTKTWENLNKFLAKKLNTELKTDLEPLDDTEELEQDREKLRKFAKDTKGKAKITLAPMQILKDVAEVREYGVKKYGSVDSWKEVPIEDYRDALFRHLLEYIKDPNGVDKESGIKHYKHIACNLAFICEMENTEDGTRSI